VVDHLEGGDEEEINMDERLEEVGSSDEIEGLEEWSEEEEWEFEEDDGVDLRDYFAGIALQAVLRANKGEINEEEHLAENAVDWAKRSYLIAEAMLAVRTVYDNADWLEDDDDEGDEEEEEEAQ
jgi:hypothetical protein